MNNIMKRYDMGVKYGFIKTESHAFIARILHFFLGRLRKGKPSRCQKAQSMLFSFHPKSLSWEQPSWKKNMLAWRRNWNILKEIKMTSCFSCFSTVEVAWLDSIFMLILLFQHPQSRKKSIFWRSQTFHYLKFWTFVFWCHRCLSRLQNSTFGLG